MYEVTSEIYAETDFNTTNLEDGKRISVFKFVYPTEVQNAVKDKDGDFEVERQLPGKIEIEHAESTVLKLVGLQVWRGALLLADFIFTNRKDFQNLEILELGAGVGLTSIAAAIYSKQVYCTDINLGGILETISSNIKRNQSLLKSPVYVLEFDFKSDSYSEQLQEAINRSDIVVAADVIYDNDLTDCFINVIEMLLNNPKKKTFYIALEKRYVFTLADLETVAPCFEYFLTKVAQKPWKLNYIPIDFPQFFTYKRCKDLVLLKVENY
ncbi:METTL22 family protein [Megaselia abdita]